MNRQQTDSIKAVAEETTAQTSLLVRFTRTPWISALASFAGMSGAAFVYSLLQSCGHH